MASEKNENSLDILQWSEEIVAKNVDLVVLEIKRMLLSVHKDQIEFLSFALENVIQHIPISSVQDTILGNLCCAVDEIYSSTLAGLESDLEGSIKLSQFDSKEAAQFLLIVCKRIMHSLRICCENLCKQSNIKCYEIEKFIECSTGILEDSFGYYNRNCHKIPELNDEYYDVLWQFNAQFWKLIIQTVDFDRNRAYDVTLLSNLLVILETNAKNSFLKPILQIAECWKNLLNFLDKFHKTYLESFKFNDIIIHLCEYLIKELGDIKTFFNDCVKNQLRSLKIYNFLLKIVVKLCKTFIEKLKECYNELVCLLLILFKMTPNFLRANNFPQDAVSEISRQIIMASEPLLSVIYSSSEFPCAIMKVLTKSCSKNPYGCTVFLLSLIKRVNSVWLKELYFSLNFDIVDLVFMSFGLCHDGILNEKFYAPGSAVSQIDVKKDMYDYVFTALAVFVLTLSTDEFAMAEVTFLKYTLQNNPWQAIMASDLWCLVVRYGNVQLCHSTLDTLIAFTSKIDLNSSRPEFTYLTCLVRRMLQFTEPQYIDSIVQLYPLKDNFLLWKYLSFHSNKSYIPIYKELTNKLKFWTDSGNSQVEDYRYLEACLHASSKSSGSDDHDSIIHLIPKLWAVDINASSVWISYFCSLTSLTIANLIKIDSRQISVIIQQIHRIFKKSSKVVEKLCILMLLKGIFNILHQFCPFQQNNFRLLFSIFYALLTSEFTMISTMAMVVFSEFVHNPNFSQIVELIGCEDVKLQNKLADFILKENPSQCEEPNLLTFFPVQNEHYCSFFKNTTSSSHDDINPIQINQVYSVEPLEAAIDRLEKDSIYIADKQNFLNPNHLQRIKSILLTLGEIELSIGN